MSTPDEPMTLHRGCYCGKCNGTYTYEWDGDENNVPVLCPECGIRFDGTADPDECSGVYERETVAP